MERGWGVHEGDTLEHATRHGTEDGRAAAEEWLTAFLAGAVGMDELPEAVEEFGAPAMRDGSDLWDHTARTDSYDDDIANGGASLSDDYRGAYNAAVRAVADEHGIELPEAYPNPYAEELAE